MKTQIRPHVAILLLVTALFFDFVSGILSFFVVTSIITPFSSVMAGMVLWMLFTLQRVRFVRNPNLTTFAAGMVIEMIPLVNALPAWTAATWRIIYLTNREARAGEKLKKEKQAKDDQEQREQKQAENAYQERLLAEEIMAQQAANDNTQREAEERNAA